jgi:nicotinamide-nucleotide amidase
MSKSSSEALASDDAALTALAASVGAALRRAALRLCVAESCTGGWIAKVLTDIPGSSDWFDCGFVTYSNRAKIAALGVSPDTLERHGAVSEAVVRQMAAGARRATGCPVALAVSGIAGPGGGSAGKPVGLVHFAWSLNERDWVQNEHLEGDREWVRRRATAIALDQLLSALGS